MRLLAKLGRVSLLVLLALQGCGEKGHVRISEKEIPGTYVASFETGKEQLILRSDKTYEQIFSSPTKKFKVSAWGPFWKTGYLDWLHFAGEHTSYAFKEMDIERS